MAVLITGGSGLVGSHTVLEFMNQGKEDRIVVYDMVPPKMPEVIERLGKDVVYVDGNVLDIGRLLEVVKKHDVDGIVHASLLGNFSYIRANPMNSVSTNFNGTLNVLELARARDLKVVYTSSGAVYGEVSGCVSEDHAIKPGDMYGMIKAMGELAGEQYAKTYGIDYVAVRLYFIYGQTVVSGFRPVSELFTSPVSPVDVISQFVLRAVRKEELRIGGGGDSELDFTYVKDSALGVVLAYYFKNPPHRAYNVSTGKAYSLKTIADIINGIAGGQYIDIGPGAVAGWPPRARCLDNSLAMQELGYIPRYDIESGLREYYKRLKAAIQ